MRRQTTAERKSIARDEESQKQRSEAAKRLAEGKLSAQEIANVTGVKRYLISR